MSVLENIIRVPPEILFSLCCRKPEEVKYFVGDESTDPNNNITMTNEDLLQPGHVVKERWRVVRIDLS